MLIRSHCGSACPRPAWAARMRASTPGEVGDGVCRLVGALVEVGRFPASIALCFPFDWDALGAASHSILAESAASPGMRIARTLVSAASILCQKKKKNVLSGLDVVIECVAKDTV